MNFSLAWKATRASLIIHMGLFMLSLYLATWVLIAALHWSSDNNEFNQAIVLIACFPTAAWWAFVSSRLLKILRDCEKLLLPSPMKAIAPAIFLQLILTVMIPASVCALMGSPFLYASATLTAVAAGSMLFMLLPRYLGIFMGFLPMLIGLLGKGGLIPTAGSPDHPSYLLLLASLLVMLSVWRFYRLRSFSGPQNSWHTPMVLLPDVRGGWGAPGLGEAGAGQAAGSDNYFNPAVSSVNPSTPALALRTYLGSPFMPLAATGKLKLFLLLILLYLGPLLLMWLANTQNSNPRSALHLAFFVAWISFFGLAMTYGAIIFRLRSLYTKNNTELAELALLPGWKNSKNARRLFLQVITQQAGFGLLIPAVIVLTALLASKIGGISVYLIVLAQFLITSFMAAAFCLNIISGKKGWVFLASQACIAFFIFAVIQILLSLVTKNWGWGAFSVIGWLVFFIASFAYLFFSWKTFKNREHVFLIN